MTSATSELETTCPRGELDELFAGGGELLMVFDGECVLCSRAVRFLKRRDPAGTIRFAAGGSVSGRRVLDAVGLSAAIDRTVVVLTAEGEVLTRSDAVLALAARLQRPWRWVRVLHLLPSRLLDAAYDWIASNRYRLFGRLPPRCALPAGDAGS